MKSQTRIMTQLRSNPSAKEETEQFTKNDQPVIANFPATFSTKLYASCAVLNSVNLGYDIGVGTIAGPMIMEEFQLTGVQLEIFLGSINFWSIFGALTSPIISDRYGRRVTLGTAAVGFLVGVVIMSTSQSFQQLLVGRVIVGLGVGVGGAIDPMYIAEISPPHCRGELVSWAELGIAFGVLLGFSSSLLDISWRGLMALGTIMPILLIGMIIFVMPESPRWLVEKNQEEKARAILATIYPNSSPLGADILADFDHDSDDGLELTVTGSGSGQEIPTPEAPPSAIDKVVQDIKDSLELEKAAAHAVGWAIMCHPSIAIRRMLTAGIGMAIIQQACGIDSITFYLMFVIQQSGISSRDDQQAALIFLGFVKVAFVVVGSKLLDKYGRRPMLLVSLLGCAISLLVVSLTFVAETPASNVATVIALAFYLAFFSIGLGPGNWVVASEIFATSIRAKAMSLAVFANRLTATVMASSFLTLSDALTLPGFLFMLTLICLGSAAFLFKLLPETKGRSLESMSHYFAEITGDRSFLETENELRSLKDAQSHSSSHSGTGEEGEGGLIT
jgi:MFS family permease